MICNSLVIITHNESQRWSLFLKKWKITQTKCIVSKQLSGMWAVKNKTAVIRVGLKWFYIVHVISKECQHHKIGNLNQYSKVEGKNKTVRHEGPPTVGPSNL